MNKKIKINFTYQNIIVFALGLIVILTIVNPSKYDAGLKYTILPSLLVISMWFFTSRKKTNITQILTIFFVLFAIISTTVSPVVSWGPPLRSFIIMCFLLIIISSIDFDNRQIKKILKVYYIVTFFSSLIIIYNFLRGGGSIDRHNLEYVFSQKDVNYLTSYMLPSFCLYTMKLLWNTSFKVSLLFQLTIIAFSIIITGSRTATFTMFFVVISSLLYYYRDNVSIKKVMSLCLIILGGIRLINYLLSSELFNRVTDFSGYNIRDDIRSRIWEYALISFQQNKLLGSGFGSASFYSISYVGSPSHNNYIEILGGQGIVGIVLFFLIIISMFLKTKKCNKILFFIIIVSFLLPQATINGYQTMSFWLAIYFIVILSNYAKNQSLIDLFT